MDGGEEKSPCVNAYVIDPFEATAPAFPPVPLTVSAGATGTANHVMLLWLLRTYMQKFEDFHFF